MFRLILFCIPIPVSNGRSAHWLTNTQTYDDGLVDLATQPGRNAILMPFLRGRSIRGVLLVETCSKQKNMWKKIDIKRYAVEIVIPLTTVNRELTAERGTVKGKEGCKEQRMEESAGLAHTF